MCLYPFIYETEESFYSNNVVEPCTICKDIYKKYIAQCGNSPYCIYCIERNIIQNKRNCRYCCNEYSLLDVNDIKKHLSCGESNRVGEDYINTLNYLLNEKTREILRLKVNINDYIYDIEVLGEKAIRY